MHSFEAYNSVTRFCKNENRSRAAQTLVFKTQLRFFFYFAENQIVYAITERHFEKKNSRPYHLLPTTLGAPEVTWGHGDTWEHLGAPGSTWEPLGARGSTWGEPWNHSGTTPGAC